MSAISRRAVLGYTGTAAAGTILAGAGQAHAAEPAQQPTATPQAQTQAQPEARAQQADASTPDFPQGTQFSGGTYTTFPGADDGTSMTITFSVQWDMVAPGTHAVTPAEIAQALSQLVQSKGWPAITFYGAPAPVAVN
ncbi:hypothetical protein [Actinacidiphila yeochonensis]|uniref:hypothetical protein n=1 Tax=Actinacidiphila yeochonensis TaxID=89050 RepID=UPI000559F5AD|nr:hypothetical protein [Actinacidiphila yeochonensis]